MAPSDIDTRSATWRAVKEEIARRIEGDRSWLEARTLPESETQFIRGRIAALRDILALPGNETPAP